MDEAYIKRDWRATNFNIPGIAPDWQNNPKSALGNYMGQNVGRSPKYDMQNGILQGQPIVRYAFAISTIIMVSGY